MSQIEVITVRCKNTLSFIRTILKELRTQGRYQPDLMYRGAEVNEEGLNLIKIYGTDRNPKTESELIMDKLSAQRDDKIKPYPECDEDEQFFRHAILTDYDPSLIWALPEKGLRICIKDYACPGTKLYEEHSIILAYLPNHLVRHYPGSSLHGTLVTKLTKKHLMDENSAIYKFKDSTPLESIVGAFKLEFIY